jgi:hypothetical protein
VTRDAQGRITVQGLAIGKNPVIVRLDPGWPAPTITSIDPAYGAQNATLDITNLAGTGFQAGASVRIERDGVTVQATDVNVVSSTKITCKLNLINAPLGGYDLVVRNTDGQEVRRISGFIVTEACGQGAELALVVVGLTTGSLSLSTYTKRRRRQRG